MTNYTIMLWVCKVYNCKIFARAVQKNSFFGIVLNKSNWSTESRHKRGYGSALDKIRVIVLKRDNGLCQCDECQGGKVRLTLANEVHHIIPKAKGGTDDLSNLLTWSSKTGQPS